MRFIDLQKLYIPPEWGPEAKTLLGKLRKMSGSKRSEAWKDSDYQLWPLMKQLLGGMSHQKCWYSEEFVSGAKGDVDHFRPKGKVAGVKPDHPGYWWAALDCSNFRFACQSCNRLYTDTLTGEVLGKGAYFPLYNEPSRSYAENATLNNEDHLLLDPTKKGDPDLLWFEESGKAVPRKSEKKDKRGLLRDDTMYLHPDILLPGDDAKPQLDTTKSRPTDGRCRRMKRVSRPATRLENGRLHEAFARPRSCFTRSISEAEVLATKPRAWAKWTSGSLSMRVKS